MEKLWNVEDEQARKDLMNMVISSMIVASKEAREHRKELERIDDDEYIQRVISSICEVSELFMPTYAVEYLHCVVDVLTDYGLEASITEAGLN